MQHGCFPSSRLLLLKPAVKWEGWILGFPLHFHHLCICHWGGQKLPGMLGLQVLSKHHLPAAAVLPLCLSAACVGWALALWRRTRRDTTRLTPPKMSGPVSCVNGGHRVSPASKLRDLLADSQSGIIVMPCCFSVGKKTHKYDIQLKLYKCFFPVFLPFDTGSASTFRWKLDS